MADDDDDTFMIRSGRKVPTPAIPMPAFAVPYAAPIADIDKLAMIFMRVCSLGGCECYLDVHPKIICNRDEQAMSIASQPSV